MSKIMHMDTQYAGVTPEKEMLTCPVGKIDMYAGSGAPNGWLLCSGQAVSRVIYPDLFAIIGTTYGSGDGSTTFNLPDMRGRMPVGVGNGTATGHTDHTLGSIGGNENAIVPYHRHTYDAPPSNTDNFTLAATNIPAHTHGSKTLTGSAQLLTNKNASKSGIVTGISGTYNGGMNAGSLSGLASVSFSATHEHSSVGGGNAHKHGITASSSNTGYAGTSGNTTGANMTPFLTINFIIYSGVYN